MYIYKERNVKIGKKNWKDEGSSLIKKYNTEHLNTHKKVTHELTVGIADLHDSQLLTGLAC